MNKGTNLTLSTNDAFRAVSRYGIALLRVRNSSERLYQRDAGVNRSGGYGGRDALPATDGVKHRIIRIIFARRVYRLERHAPTEPMLNRRLR
ncbi:hypothetical protein KCP70_14480 [Salmonella enterica subsp. enterica]|nr:hypothetical protein KCP70_14480 [Salmonella enterica subsp. enterica]